jgi:hypothetical protein
MKVAASAAIVVMMTGYFVVYRSAELAIAQRYAQIAAKRGVLALRVRRAARLTAFTRDRTNLVRELGGFGLSTSPAETVARFLRTTEDFANEQHATIISLVGSGAPYLSSRRGQIAQDISVTDIPFDVTIHGTYMDLIQLMHQWSRTNLAAHVAIASIANDEADSSQPRGLTALFRVTLECVNDERRLVAERP